MHFNFISSLSSKYTENAYRITFLQFIKFCVIKDTDCYKLLKYFNTKIEGKIRYYIVYEKK